MLLQWHPKHLFMDWNTKKNYLTLPGLCIPNSFLLTFNLFHFLQHMIRMMHGRPKINFLQRHKLYERTDDRLLFG